jgi:ATP-dependent DNA ligase
MLAVAGQPFDSPDYSFEIKWDGVRALAATERGSAWRLWGREAGNYTSRYPEVAGLAKLPTGTILDGELVQLVDGRADFARLLRRHQLSSRRKIALAAEQQPIAYIVFDLLQLKGRSYMNQPLAKRRQRLAELLGEAQIRQLVFSRAVLNAGQVFFRQVVEQGHEGVMAKRLDSPYCPGRRSAAWQKIKPELQLACLIVGYRGDSMALERLLLAAEREGKLCFVGEVHAGLTESLRRELALLIVKYGSAKAQVHRPSRYLRPGEQPCLVRSVLAAELELLTVCCT